MTKLTRIALGLAAVSLLAGCGGGSSSNSGSAPPPSYLGLSAHQVANEIGCRWIIERRLASAALSAGDCRLEGRRVELLTFVSHQQQVAWGSVIIKHPEVFGDNHHWAAANGAVIEDPAYGKTNGLAVAQLGARHLPGSEVMVN